MNILIEQYLCALKQFTRKHSSRCGSISDLIVLVLCHFDQHFCSRCSMSISWGSWRRHLLLWYRRSNEHLVHAFGPSVVLTAAATAFTAIILLFGLPFHDFFQFLLLEWWWAVRQVVLHENSPPDVIMSILDFCKINVLRFYIRISRVIVPPFKNILFTYSGCFVWHFLLLHYRLLLALCQIGFAGNRPSVEYGMVNWYVPSDKVVWEYWMVLPILVFIDFERVTVAFWRRPPGYLCTFNIQKL